MLKLLKIFNSQTCQMFFVDLTYFVNPRVIAKIMPLPES